MCKIGGTEFPNGYSVNVHDCLEGGVCFSFSDWEPDTYRGYLTDTRYADGTSVGTWWNAFASDNLEACFQFMWEHKDDPSAL